MEAKSPHPERHTSDLYRGRWSAAESLYFITCCVQRPWSHLTTPTTAAILSSSWRNMEMAGDAILECATIMPDHFHALLVLGNRLHLGRVVAKFKALTRSALLSGGGSWQRDFFEHHLRPNEHPSPFARYIFLNPYRAGLLERRAVWPHTHIRQGADFDFLSMLEDDRYPPQEWLALPADKLGVNLQSLGGD